jgi:predicted Zn-dependent peptidase|nr:pitrilysin family protein [Actinomycetota bacterium]
MFYRETVLENGVTVLTESIDTVRSVAIGMWFSVGSRDESGFEAGMSHFMEHMMFKGTPTRSAAEISQVFDSLGAELNAFTSKEYTCYYARVIDQHVPIAVEVLSDMVVNATLAQDACDSEREVVIEEIARMEDTPDDRIHELFAKALWPDHPLGLPILGSRESVGSFGHTESAAFREHHYVTGNCVVAAAGNLSHEDLVALVREHLNLPVGLRSERPIATSGTASRLALLSKDTEQAHICFGVSGLNAHHGDRFTLSVVDTVLGGGMSSRLFQEIREKRGLAYAVYSFHALYQDTGQWAVYAGTRPGNAEEVVGMIRAELDRVATDGITDEELLRAQNAIKGHIVLGMESTRNRMARLGKNAVIGGELLAVDEVVRRIDAVTMTDVRRVTADVLEADATLAMIGPFKEDEVAHLV